MTPTQIGNVIRTERKRQGLTQPDLALISGTGIRFIVDTENGKATCRIGKVLHVLNCLGLDLIIIPKGRESASIVDTQS